MYESLSALELRQDELFDRIVHHLGVMASVDADDATIRGVLAEAAEALIGARQDQAADAVFVFEQDPILAELVGAYEDVGQSISELLATDAGTEWTSDPAVGEMTEHAPGLGAARDWSDDR